MTVQRIGGANRRQILLGGLGLATTAAAKMPAIPRNRSVTPTIFGTGGSFLPASGERPHFPRYLMNLARDKHPRICWLGAAGGEQQAAFDTFAKGMGDLGCKVRHLDMFKPETIDFTDYLLGFDIVYVNGGSSRNLMAIWREWGMERALYAAWQSGVVMAGHSAGCICWFQGGLTDSYPKLLGPVKTLGFLQGSADPHYNIRPDRRTRFHELIADGRLESPGLALEQDTGVLYRGTELIECVSTKAGSGAFRLTRVSGIAEERALPVRFLGV